MTFSFFAIREAPDWCLKESIGSKGGVVRNTCLILTLIITLAACSAPGQIPKASHIWPDAGLNEQTTYAHIYGIDLRPPPVASAWLMAPGEPDVQATSIDVVSDLYMTCSFDLMGSATGLYDLVVENSSGRDTLEGCFTVYARSDTPTIWIRSDVGTGGNRMYGVAVGDGDNDRGFEVYGANRDYEAYQYQWNGTGWDANSIGFGAYFMNGVAVGDGDNDGEAEVFGANHDGVLYRYTWTGADWVRDTTGRGGTYMLSVAVGDGNGDGEMEVYGGDDLGVAYQFKWDGGVWNEEVLGSGMDWMRAVAVGDGDGDGEMEVYGANMDNNVFRFKWDGASWLTDTLGTAWDYMLGLAIGDGNNDGAPEVYGASWDYTVYQFKWDGVNWLKTTVGSATLGMYGVAVGDGNGDGEMEVYAACRDRYIYQFRWDGMAWSKTTVGEGGSDMRWVAVGDGNSDGQLEVYGANDDYYVYQFKPAQIGVAEGRVHDPDFRVDVRVDAAGTALFTLNTPGTGDLTLRIYDAAGRLVAAPFSGQRTRGVHETVCVALEACGVYFYHIESSWGDKSDKFVVLR